jgi:Arc/MetJ-type ribon-helix-helix transcriptional regulator
MRTKKLENSIKFRLPDDLRRLAERIAQERFLDLSDVVREALREYVAKHKPAEPEPRSEPEMAKEEGGKNHQEAA